MELHGLCDASEKAYGPRIYLCTVNSDSTIQTRLFTAKSRINHSRGQTPKEFLRPSIWKNGPEWLQQTEEHWPIWNPLPLVEVPEQKGSTCLVANPIDHTILEKYLSWSKLIRVVVR